MVSFWNYFSVVIVFTLTKKNPNYEDKIKHAKYIHLVLHGKVFSLPLRVRCEYSNRWSQIIVNTNLI